MGASSLGCQDLADLIKASASPAPSSLPTARRRTVDVAEMLELAKAVEDADWDAQPERRKTLDPKDILTRVQKAAMPVGDDHSVPQDRLGDIDILGVQVVCDVLRMGSPHGAQSAASILSSSSSSSKRAAGAGTEPPAGGEASDLDAGSEGEGHDSDDSVDDGGASRPTIDPTAFDAHTLRRVSSPAGDDVPEERRLHVDSEVVAQLVGLVSGAATAATADSDNPVTGAKATPGNRKRRTTVDAGEFYDMIRLALSPGVAAAADAGDGSEDEEEDGGGSGGAADGKRRHTIDPSEFANLLAGLSSAKKAPAPAGDDAEAGGPATPGNAKRRQTVDGTEFVAMLKGLAISTPGGGDGGVSTPGAPTPQSTGRKSSAKEAAPSSRKSAAKKTQASAKKKDDRRMTIDADDMLALMASAMTQSPNPASPYVSPPVSARTRRGSLSATKATSASKKAVGGSESAKRRRSSKGEAAVPAPVVAAAGTSLAAAASPAAKKKRAPVSPAAAAAPTVAASSPMDSLQAMSMAAVNTASLGKKGRKASAPATHLGTVADVLGSLGDEGSPPPAVARARVAAAAQSASQPAPSSALKSCLSSKKASRRESTPGKSVLFGAANAAEFRRSDPSSALTPMHKDRAQAFFPMTTESEEPHVESPEESSTKVNSRILAAWGDSNNVALAGAMTALGSAVQRSPRRMSGKFSKPAPDSLANSSSSSEEAGNGDTASAASSRRSSIGAGDDCMGNADDSNVSTQSAFQSRMDSVAADDFDPTQTLEMNLGAIINLGARRSSVGGKPAAAAARGTRGAEDQTEELEVNLNGLLHGRRRSSAVGVAALASGRPSVGGEDSTVELEGQLGGLLAKLAGSPAPAAALKPRGGTVGTGAFAAADSGDDDYTCELEGGLGDILGAAPEAAKAVASPDNTVELEAALADLVGGPGDSYDEDRDACAPTRPLTPYKSPAGPNSSRGSIISALSNSSRCLSGRMDDDGEEEEGGGDLEASQASNASGTSHLSTRSAAASNAYGLLLDQAAGASDHGGLDLLDSSNASSFAGSAAKPPPRRGNAGLFEDSSVKPAEDEAEAEPAAAAAAPLPPHLAEFEELLAGLGLRTLSTAPTGALAAAPDFAYAAQVESEVLASCADTVLINPRAAEEMAKRLWAHAREVRLAAAGGGKPHVVEALLRAERRRAAGQPLSGEEEALVAEAVVMAADCRAMAEAAWADYELKMLTSLEARLEEATVNASLEAEVLREARAKVEQIDASAEAELRLAESVARLEEAERAAASAAAGLASAAEEAAALEEELAEAEAAKAYASSRAETLAAAKESEQAVADLREEKVAAAAAAALALERFQVAAAMRSWVPKSLGGPSGDVIVEFPLGVDAASRGSSGQTLAPRAGQATSLTLTLACGAEGAEGADLVQRVSWALTTRKAAAAPHPKRAKGLAPALPPIAERPGSALGALQARLVNEWVGREAGRLGARPAALRDVPKTLNRFDALMGRLRLVLAEVRAVEDLGLDVTFRDGNKGLDEDGDDDEAVLAAAAGRGDEESDEEENDDSGFGAGLPAGLWLQVDMASVKHHCKCRLEVRVVDGYPWAPAEVRLVPLLGTPPRALSRHVLGLARGMLPGGAPLVSGAGAVVKAITDAYGLFR